MVHSAEICLGAIVAIAIIVISYFAWRKWRPPSPKITYTTPASPELVKVAGGLTAVLQGIVAVGSQLDTECSPEVSGSIHSVTLPATRMVEKLEVPKPTYANYHAVYRVLCDADDCYLRVADVYISKGRELAGSEGPALIGMGKQLQLLVRAVHELGTALNLE